MSGWPWWWLIWWWRLALDDPWSIKRWVLYCHYQVWEILALEPMTRLLQPDMHEQAHAWWRMQYLIKLYNDNFIHTNLSVLLYENYIYIYIYTVELYTFKIGHQLHWRRLRTSILCVWDRLWVQLLVATKPLSVSLRTIIQALHHLILFGKLRHFTRYQLLQPIITFQCYYF